MKRHALTNGSWLRIIPTRTPVCLTGEMPSPRLEIHYCTQCKFLLRAAWLAQELLTTFEGELAEVAVIPGSGGVFEVRLDGESIFSRKEVGRFPEPREIKELLRDRIAPGKPIGHQGSAG